MERCFYVAGSADALMRFRRALKSRGVDTGVEVARGALIESTHAEAHLAGGAFDCEAMLEELNSLVI